VLIDLQAQLPPHMEQQLLLQDFLQHIEARGCNTSVSAALASSTAAATPPTSSSSAAALEDDDAESCKLFFSQAPRVWVSPAGAVSPLHYDTSHSFLLQVRLLGTTLVACDAISSSTCRSACSSPLQFDTFHSFSLQECLPLT
jgi:hypothetical protein